MHSRDDELYGFNPDRLDDPVTEALKETRLRYTIAEAWENHPVYQEALTEAGMGPEDVQSVEDLHNLRTVTGEEVRQQPYRFRNPEADLRREFWTSATTGEPKPVAKSYDQWRRLYDDARRGWQDQFGVTSDAVIVNYAPTVALNMSGYFVEWTAEAMGAETVPVHDTELPVEREAALLDQKDPDFLISSPSHIDTKGRYFERNDVDPYEFGVDGIIVGGEPISDSRSDRIAEMFGAEVYPFFPSTELGGAAYRCLDGEGYHILEDSVHLSVLDGEIQETGRGRLLATNLLHPGEEAGTLLINYELGDRATLSYDSGRCACPLSGGRIMEDITRENWTFTLGGANVDARAVEEQIYAHSEAREAVDEYQLVRREDAETGQDELDILLEPKDGERIGEDVEDVTMEEEYDTMTGEIGQNLLSADRHLRNAVDEAVSGEGAARVNVRPVDSIDTGRGKPVRVVNEAG